MYYAQNISDVVCDSFVYAVDHGGGLNCILHLTASDWNSNWIAYGDCTLKNGTLSFEAVYLALSEDYKFGWEDVVLIYDGENWSLSE